MRLLCQRHIQNFKISSKGIILKVASYTKYDLKKIKYKRDYSSTHPSGRPCSHSYVCNEQGYSIHPANQWLQCCFSFNHIPIGTARKINLTPVGIKQGLFDKLVFIIITNIKVHIKRLSIAVSFIGEHIFMEGSIQTYGYDCVFSLLKCTYTGTFRRHREIGKGPLGLHIFAQKRTHSTQRWPLIQFCVLERKYVHCTFVTWATQVLWTHTEVYAIEGGWVRAPSKLHQLVSPCCVPHSYQGTLAGSCCYQSALLVHSKACQLSSVGIDCDRSTWHSSLCVGQVH